jgi:hypothetical protein
MTCATGYGKIVFRGIIDRLIEAGRCFGVEMSVEKTKVLRISKQLSAIEIMVDQK